VQLVVRLDEFVNNVVVAMLSRDRGHDLGAETSILRQFLSDTVAIEADDPVIEDNAWPPP
jgi:hypothetical protein